jgi:hypothetical protein
MLSNLPETNPIPKNDALQHTHVHKSKRVMNETLGKLCHMIILYKFLGIVVLLYFFSLWTACSLFMN